MPETPTSARRALSPEMRAHTGLTYLPEPTEPAEFAASLRRHYPAQLRARGVSGTTLVDAYVDAQGRVGDVEVIARPGGPPHQKLTALLQDASGSSVAEINDRPEFGAAAQAALRETRFHPAVRDGRPVAYKLRMTVHFDPKTSGA